MRVMTFNLRFENDQDGGNAWNYRRHLVMKLIEQYSPDILGTQEGRVSQLDYLEENLSDYQMHAPSRVLDDTCQYPTLFFRKDLFRIMEGNEFWLSKTPQIHRSKNWDSAFPRMLSTATVELPESQQTFSVAVTHLDHMGPTARVKQAEMIARWVRKKTVPVILMGDFNDGPGSEPHGALVNQETGLSDSWEVLGHPEGEESFTHHAFTGTPQKSRIDWILSTVPPYIMDARIIHDQLDGRYASDHFPYCVDLSWEIP
ncbi:MAG: endonuclease/exonuclease/phosphatase family protein [Deltaproteobacteria bacterium]|nr:endonuclease/exonuclease/phosphatase family protein [Deltaproteobacteria bacterium]